MIVTRFPPPPQLIGQRLAHYRALAGRYQLPGAAAEPRPWLPDSCTGQLREQLWQWLDGVADWINRDYAWRGTTMIPPCWPAHPWIGHELAPLACLRVHAATAATPEPLQQWHDHTLPGFLDRLTARLGEDCRSDHASWPGRSRWHSYHHPVNRELRAQALLLDHHHQEEPE